jgi:hypothetical protein
MTDFASTGSPDSALARFVAAPRAAALLLALIAFALFLPGFATLQPMDRDEPRFAQATKQMLETGDFVDIRFQGEARHKKPVGIYWMQAATVRAGEALGVPAARTQDLALPAPSLIAAVAAVLLVWWAALALLSSTHAFLAALLFAATILIGVEARLAKTDAVVTGDRRRRDGRVDPRPAGSCRGLAAAGDLLDSGRHRRSGQGADHADDPGLRRARAVDPRPLGALAHAAAPARGPRLDGADRRCPG